jgi:EmrB/QacA subfamily drug resistance transporter
VGALVYSFLVLPKDDPRPSESFDFIGVLMMSPGLALFLYGVSSIPAEGKIGTPKVLLPALIGLALVISFVFYSFKPKHPLLDLRLFRNRNLAISILTMFLFAVAFFGGLLLVPTYFQQIRGESVLHAGLLVAPQGLGAMLTMPIAGALSDKIPVGRIVPFGLVFIAAGMFGLTQITSTTSYSVLIGILFVMGLGMGGTMMPIMTSALKTLRSAEVSRGSTLLNITQQIASSVGVAVMSVVLTNALKDAKLAYPAIAARHDPQIAAQIGGEAGIRTGLAQAAEAFAHSYWVAFSLVAVTVVAALFLPRKREEAHLLDDDPAGATPVIVH